MYHNNCCTSAISIPGRQTSRRYLQWMGCLGSRWIINLCSSLYSRVANVKVATLLDGKIKIRCLCLAKLFVHCNFQLPLFIRFVVLSGHIIAISYGIPRALYWNAKACCNSKTRMPELSLLVPADYTLKLPALCKIQSNRPLGDPKLAFLYITYSGTVLSQKMPPAMKSVHESKSFNT
jgi:hypothetical protein